MTFTLHAATVSSWLQLLEQVSRMIDKADAFCAETGTAPAELIEARLAPDMLPFAYQVKSCAVHSLGAIEGVRRGSFSPDETTPPDSFPTLKARVRETMEALAALDPAEVDSFVGRDMVFAFGDRQMPFLAENFLLSFSIPNFYFHATTAYDILRWKGVALGKRDYLGRPQTKV